MAKFGPKICLFWCNFWLNLSKIMGLFKTIFKKKFFWLGIGPKLANFRPISSWICVLVENLINRYILFFGKAPEKGLFLCFGFAAFAVFAVANVCQFADCRGKGNWRQNAMYTVGTYLGGRKKEIVLIWLHIRGTRGFKFTTKAGIFSNYETQ